MVLSLLFLRHMELFEIPCGTLEVDAAEMFNHLAVDRISAYYNLDERGRMRIPMNTLLVVHKNRTVLFDPGCADFLPKRIIQSYGLIVERSLEEVLDEKGFMPESITDVVFTHLHFDHGSGAFLRVPGNIVKRFPAARYHIHKAHFDYVSNPDPVEQGTFFSTLFNYIEDVHWLEDWEESWLSFHVYSGHTRHMVVPEIQGGDRPVYFLSDLVPMAIFMESDVNSGYDRDPQLARMEKKDFLETVKDPSRMFYYHEPLKNSEIYP